MAKGSGVSGWSRVTEAPSRREIINDEVSTIGEYITDQVTRRYREFTFLPGCGDELVNDNR